MKRRSIYYAIFAVFIACASTASYFYYERVVVPERISQEREQSINGIVSMASKEVDAFMLKTTEDGVTFEEVFKSADRAIESIDKSVARLLTYSKEDGGSQLVDALDYVRGCAAAVRHTKTFFHRGMLRRASEERVDSAIGGMKDASNKYELDLLKKRGDEAIKDLKKHALEQCDAALSLAEQGKVLIDIGQRERIAAHALISSGALDRGLALAQSVLPQGEARPSGGSAK